MKSLQLTACNFMFCVDYKIELKFIFWMDAINFSYFTCSRLLSAHHPLPCFPEGTSKPASLLNDSINFWSYTFSFITSSFRSSSKHFIQIKTSLTTSSISFWLYTLSLITCCFLSSSMPIKSSTPNVFVLHYSVFDKFSKLFCFHTTLTGYI